MNNYLDNVQLSTIPGPNGSGIPEHVPNGKWDIALYSDPNNANDIYGGIWFHNSQTGTNVYNNRVVDIFLERGSGGCFRGWSGTGIDVTMEGFTPGNTCTATISDLAWTARLILHEIGHHLSLSHVTYCNNNCRTIDIDTEAHCQPNCATSWTCDDVNPINNVTCPATGSNVSRCTWGVGNNIMSQGFNQRALTPCQWERVFNYVASRPTSLKYGWANDCTEIEPTHYLEEGSNVTWNSLMLLNRNIVVTKGAILTINCEVRMAEAAQIIVHRGGKLIVDDGKITNLCPGKRWGGIAVHGNASKEQPDPSDVLADDDAGVVIIQNGSIIENATTAIETSAPGWPWPDLADRWGGVVIAENSEFKNNRRSIAFMKYTFNNKSRITGCTFHETSGAGVQNSDGVTIWDCDLITFDGNTFENLDGTAIFGIDYGGDILNNNFTNMTRGIELLSTAPFSSWALIENNNFVDNQDHIVANATSGQSGLHIVNNDFTDADVGAWIEGESVYFIIDNEFTNLERAVVTTETSNSSSDISNNSFNTHSEAINLIGNNEFTTFLQNCFINTDTDVVIEANGTSIGTVRSTQGNTVNSASNCFFATNNTDIKSSTANTSPFTYFVPTGGASCTTPTNNLSDGGTNNYFVATAQNDLNSCGQSPVQQPPLCTENDLTTVKGNLVQAHSNLMQNIKDPALLVAYDNTKKQKDKTLNCLLTQYAIKKQWANMESLLQQESSKIADKALYGVYLQQKKWNEAQASLNNFTVVTVDDLTFKTTQNILLAKLSGNQPIEGNPSEQNQLLQLASTNHPSRGYAKAMLAWLYDIPFQIDPKTSNSNAKWVESNTNYQVNQAEIFPNPANNRTIVKYKEVGVTTEEENAVAILYGLTGRELARQKLNNEGETTFNTASLNTGVYFIEIRKGNIRVSLEKLFIAK